MDDTRAPHARHLDFPWRKRSTRRDAIGIAFDLRTSRYETILQRILTWPADRVVEALLAAAAMIDIDSPPSDLLAWDTNGNGTCRSGHPWTHESSYIDGRTGYRRCRICAREYRAAKRAEAAA